MKQIITTILLAQLVVFVNAQYQTNTKDVGSEYFLNPIFAGDYPDPSILRDGDTYYIVHSSFEYYPGLMIWKSKDLINWTPVANALHKYLGSVWAPDLAKYKDKYYIYFPDNSENILANLRSWQFVTEKNVIKRHVFLRLKNINNTVDMYYSADGAKWNKIENSLEVSGMNHNVLSGFLSLRIGLCSIGNGSVKFKNFKYKAIK